MNSVCSYLSTYAPWSKLIILVVHSNYWKKAISGQIRVGNVTSHNLYASRVACLRKAQPPQRNQREKATKSCYVTEFRSQWTGESDAHPCAFIVYFVHLFRHFMSQFIHFSPMKFHISVGTFFDCMSWLLEHCVEWGIFNLRYTSDLQHI